MNEDNFKCFPNIVLGKGGFASIYLGYYNERLVAVKALKKEDSEKIQPAEEKRLMEMLNLEKKKKMKKKKYSFDP